MLLRPCCWICWSFRLGAWGLRLGYLSLHAYLPCPHGIVSEFCAAMLASLSFSMSCWLLRWFLAAPVASRCSFLVAHMAPLARH